VRLLASLAGVSLLTWIAFKLLAVNAPTAGFMYLLLVLAVAAAWGFWEACTASIGATLCYNVFFLPPIGTVTIADPQNRVALFTFLATAIIASRLRTEAKRRSEEALARQQDLERLYAFSRAILLIGKSDAFQQQLLLKLADIFELSGVVLYDRRVEEFYRAGPAEIDGVDDQLREAALKGTSFSDTQRHRIVTAVRLGAQPIAGLALQGAPMPDSVLQGIANLVAIGLERAQAQELASQVEAAERSEKLRSTLLDAMAHEFKTPLTSVIAATSALLDNPNQSADSRGELLKIADEEAHRLKALIEDTVEIGRLDSADIRVQAEPAHVEELVREVVASMRTEIEDRPFEIGVDANSPAIAVDRRLVKLAVRQLLDNALKYSPPGSPVQVHVENGTDSIAVSVTDHGKGITGPEQRRIFERLYRSPSVERQIPGSGLGLSIALNIARAHHGDLSVTSRPGETTFRLTLPLTQGGEE
jgi:two-component system sensor histidine kinase KdpD